MACTGVTDSAYLDLDWKRFPVVVVVVKDLNVAPAIEEKAWVLLNGKVIEKNNAFAFKYFVIVVQSDD